MNNDKNATAEEISSFLKDKLVQELKKDLAYMVSRSRAKGHVNIKAYQRQVDRMIEEYKLGEVNENND